MKEKLKVIFHIGDMRMEFDARNVTITETAPPPFLPKRGRLNLDGHEYERVITLEAWKK